MFRPANFTWSLITLVLLCSNAVPAYDFYNPENQASERLEKLKLALVDYALDNGFKVNASAWLDENGAVAEDVYLVSTLNLESLRFDEVTNEFGYPEDAIVEVRQIPEDQLSRCSSGSTIKRRLQFSNVRVKSNGNTSERLGRETANILETVVLASQSLSEVALVELSQSQQGSFFSQFVTLQKTYEPNVILEANVTVKPKNGFRMERGSLLQFGRVSHELSLELKATENGTPIFAGKATVLVGPYSSPYEMPTMTRHEATRLALTEMVYTLIDGLSEAIQCKASASLSLKDGFGERRLDGGEDLGVYPDQQFLLVPNSRKFSGMGLQRATMSVALVKAEKIYGDYTTITPLAGELPDYGVSGFIVIPLDAVDFRDKGIR